MVELAHAASAYAQAALGVWSEVGQRFQQQLAAAETRPEGPGEALDLWNTAVDETLMRFHRSEAFADLQRRFLRAAMRYRQEQRRIVERAAELYDLPTRSELERENRALKRRVEAACARAGARLDHGRDVARRALRERRQLIDFQRKLAETTRQLAGMRDHHVDLATLPKTEVHRIGSKILYHCGSPAGPGRSAPVLVAYALVGRYTLLDLQEDRSFLRQLVDAGLDVYAIDWGHPARTDHFDDLGDYVDGYLDAFVDAVRERSGHDAINLFGICQGGVLALCYAALFPEKVRNLVLAVTPVDFHADQTEDRPDRGFMNVWARALEADDIELLVEALGNLPGDIGGVAFSMMTPLRSLTKYNLTLVEVGQDETKLLNFLRMEKWLADRPAHPGGVARQWLNDLYRENKLVRGEFEVVGRRVDLRQVTMPVLNIYTETDHIIPPPMTKALRQHVGSKDYAELAVKGGHIGVFVGGAAQQTLRERVKDWLEAR